MRNTACNSVAAVARLCAEKDCLLLVDEAEDILLITDDGTLIRMPVSSISTLGRNTQGVRLMRVEEGCRVVCVARAEAEEEESEEDSDEAPDELDRIPDEKRQENPEEE